MALRVYNTMTRSKEPFVPLREGRVGMYACGVTVYDLSHIGHARAIVVFDVIYRYLVRCGYEVTYVRNYTDVDDKIIKRANEESVAFQVVSERYIEEFDKDMAALGVTVPTHTPRATEHINEMIAMVSTLIEKEFAYEVDGDVYFNVGSFGEYGKLSGKDTESLQSGARVEVDERKRSPLDFALWKKSKPNEPWWECPWGRGRPGWHIECSAMSQKYLGETFDIHGGGMDLVFPHHENEIAQAECTTGKPFARYWIHNGFVNINQEKMSKSLKNFLTIREVLESYSGEVVRLFLLSHHYRSPVDFSEQNLAEARSGLDRLYALLQDLGDEDLFCADSAEAGAEEQKVRGDLAAFREKFKEAMDDDFNTAAALGHLYALTRELNGLIARRKKDVALSLSRAFARDVRQVFMEAGALFGLMQDSPAVYFDKQKQSGIAAGDMSADEIEQLIAERNQARSNKDWAAADAIRDKLAEKGIVLKDSPQGTLWSIQ